VTVNELKHQFEELGTIALSSVNAEKKQKILMHYDVAEQLEWITFDNLSMIGNQPTPFAWGEAGEDAHATQYAEYQKHIPWTFPSLWTYSKGCSCH